MTTTDAEAVQDGWRGVDIWVVIARHDEKVSQIRQYSTRVRGEQLPSGTDSG